MKKFIASLAAVGAVLGAGGVVSAPVAGAAYPSHCGSYIGTGTLGGTAVAHCSRGHGQVRVVAGCRGVFGVKAPAYGPWVRTNGTLSTVRCPGFQWMSWSGFIVR